MKMRGVLVVLLVLFFVSSVSALGSRNSGDYYNNLYNISVQMKNGTANVMVIGDSINAQTSTQTMFYGYRRQFRPDNWRGMVTQGFSGVSDMGTYSTDVTTNVSSSLINPGEAFGDGSKGFNIQKVNYYNFTGEYPNAGTLMDLRLNTDYANWSDDWSNNTNIALRFIYVSNTNSTELRLKAITRAGTASTTSAFVYLNNAPQGVYWINATYPSGTGTAATGCQIQVLSQNESNPAYKFFFPVGCRIYKADATTGLQLAYAGAGGFTTKMHSVGESGTIDSRTFVANYSSTALAQMINATESNVFMIWLGQNSAGDEWDGTTVRNYSKNVVDVINKYANAYYAINATSGKPRFLLISTYDTDADNAKFTQMSTALLNLSANYTYNGLVEVGFIDLRKKINETNGGYTSWQGTYLKDGVHPSYAGSDLFANYIWAEINNSYYADAVVPNITLVYPTNTTYSTNRTELNYSVTDNVAVGSCWYSLNGGTTNTSVTCGTNVTGITSVEGNNTWTVYVNDTTGNVNSSSVTFNVDSTAPRLSIVYPTSTTYTAQQTALNYSVSDTNLQACWYSLNSGVTNTTITCGTNVTSITSSEGSNTWKVYANDSLGNQNYSSVTFTVSLSSSNSSDSSDSSSSSSSSGGGYWYGKDHYYNANDDISSLTGGISEVLSRRSRIHFSYLKENHALGVLDIKLSDSSVLFELASTPQQFTLREGESKDADIDSDGTNDVRVTLNSFDSNWINVSLKYIASPTKTNPDRPESSIPVDEIGSYVKQNSGVFFAILLALIVIAVFSLIYYFKSRSKRR